MKLVPKHRGKIDLLNNTNTIHDRVCKWVTELKDHATNFPNDSRT